MTNSRNKGARGEREFRDELKKHGFCAHRGQQYKGGNDSPDVDGHGLPIHFEVKFEGRHDLRGAYLQARSDCGGNMPVVAHRLIRRGLLSEPWMITLSVDDFLHIVKEAHLTTVQK